MPQDNLLRGCCEKCDGASTINADCLDLACPCHITLPQEEKKETLEQILDKKEIREILGDKADIDYERNHSHYHCWHQDQPPACGIPLEKHKQCCLCDTPTPTPDWEERFDNLPSTGMTTKDFIKQVREEAIQSHTQQKEREIDFGTEEYPSFWRTVVRSKEWQDWEGVAHTKGFDYHESMECGWLGSRHFEAFLAFVKEAHTQQMIERVNELDSSTKIGSLYFTPTKMGEIKKFFLSILKGE